MSSDRVLDYLTEELVVGKNIVTYRSLSHALRIHVNEAKNELASYHSEHAGSLEAAYATYLISGEPRVSYLDSVREDKDEMAVDEETIDDDGSEDVPETKITLVGEYGLESSKEQYARIHFIHVYSLSPSHIREPALLCEPAKSLREAGKDIGAGFTVALGRVTGPHITKRKKIQQTRSHVDLKSAVASTSKNKLPGLSKAASLPKDAKPAVKSEPRDVKLEAKEEPSKPKPSGKLDFSKAKLVTPKVEPAEPSLSTKAAPKQVPKPSKSKDKPPVKRKPTLKLSDSEDETAGSSSKPPSKRSESQSAAHARVKKGVVISDDDEEVVDVPKPPRAAKAAYKTKAKAAPPDSDAEKDVRAMMDIDDENVTKVSRAVTLSESATSPPVSDVDMEAREPEPAAPTRARKRKPKKEVPVGRNGLKKKRVVKSRMTTDDKGYFVTEDYSSYESVDEEAPSPVPEKPAKGKGKGKGKEKKVAETAVVKDEDETDEKTAKGPAKSSASGLKRKPSKPSVQKGGIASYFNKK